MRFYGRGGRGERRSAATSALALLLLAAACSYPYYFWLRPGSTATELVFAHGYKPHGKKAGTLDYFEVTSCGGYEPDLRKIPTRQFWHIQHPYTDTTQRTAPIIYGVVPEGYVAKVSAAPLTPGCYQVRGSLPGASGSLNFRILGDGTAVEFTKGELDSMYAVSRTHAAAELVADSLAVLMCRQAYASAGPDGPALLKVDSMIPYDTTRFSTLRCGQLRSIDPRMRGAE